VTALALGLAVFACTVAAISALTSASGDRDSRRRWATRALTAAALLVSVATIVLSHTSGRESGIEWQAAFLLAAFALLQIALTAVCIRSAPTRPFWSGLSYPEFLQKRLSRAAAWLRPVDSYGGLVKALAGWVVLPFAFVAVAQWLAGQAAPVSLPQEQLIKEVLVRGALAALTEEWWFRWLPLFFFARFFSDRRLIFPFFTVLWVVLHPYARLMAGVPAEAVLWGLTGWCLSAVFYYKVWRGPFFWTAFIVHFSTNVGVIFVHNYLGVL